MISRKRRRDVLGYGDRGQCQGYRRVGTSSARTTRTGHGDINVLKTIRLGDKISDKVGQTNKLEPSSTTLSPHALQPITFPQV